MRKSVPKCGDAWGCNFSVWRLEFSAGLQMQQPPRGGTWVGSTCNILKSKPKLCNASTTGRMAAYFNLFQNLFNRILI
ncbi:hypothetical protein V1477_014137 [Vespula maculifrons]|uniref:Uncharacterized protein n=1 Tax=Vespula maculifrons TaxID=7453 RepID=A0ABD2BKQ7_VESMC